MLDRAGILAIWHDIVPEKRDAVLEWYNFEHHFERLRVPGFRNVRRYHEVDGGPELFIRYETESAATLDSPDYLARLNDPTPWTLSSQPNFRNNSRTVCERVRSSGKAEAGIVVPLRIMAAAGEGPGADRLLALLEQATADACGVVALEVWLADGGRSSIATREKELRQGEDVQVAAVALVHVADLDAAERVRHALSTSLPSDLRDRADLGVFQLAFFAG